MAAKEKEIAAATAAIEDKTQRAGETAVEIVSLMLDAPQRNEAYAMLTEMDPAHIGTYDGLVNSR